MPTATTNVLWNFEMKNKKTFALIYMNADCLCEGFVFSNFPEINNKKDILLISHDERS